MLAPFRFAQAERLLLDSGMSSSMFLQRLVDQLPLSAVKNCDFGQKFMHSLQYKFLFQSSITGHLKFTNKMSANGCVAFRLYKASKNFRAFSHSVQEVTDKFQDHRNKYINVIKDS